ncbi:hypothetical protein GCM10027347_14340 [Larkinella harenae]
MSGLLLLGYLTTGYGQEKPLFNLRKQMVTDTPTAGKLAKPVVPGGDFKKTKLTGDFISEGVAVADLNGDRRADYITGKRFLAHHGRDPGDSD